MAEIVKVAGLRELERALKELPRNVQRNVLKQTLLKAALPIRDAARANAPVLAQSTPYRKAGTVRKNIIAQSLKPRDGHTATVGIGVKRLSARRIETFKRKQAKRGLDASGANNPNDPFYWRFLEFGTSKMAARPFLRPAFESKKDQAVNDIKTGLAAGIETEAAKLKR